MFNLLFNVWQVVYCLFNVKFGQILPKSNKYNNLATFPRVVFFVFSV